MKTSLVVFFAVFLFAVIILMVLPLFLAKPGSAPAVKRAAEITQGVFRSDDRGRTWQPKAAIGAGAGDISQATVNDLSMDPRDPNTLYLLTDGDGLYQTFDRGESWGAVRDSRGILKPNADVLRLAVNRADPREWYAAVFDQNRGRVLRTADSGDSFEEIYAVSVDRFGVFDLYLHNGASPVDAVTGQGGYLETFDRGRTWRVLRWFLDGLVRLLVNPANPAERFVVSSRGSVFKTADGGNSWTDITPNFRSFSGATENQRLVVDQNGRIYLGSNYGLLVSRDGGASFGALDLLIPPEALPVRAIVVDPTDAGHLLVAASNQLYETSDSGATWAILPSPANGVITHILFDYKNPSRIYAVVGK